jgi:hypothetical protein
MMHSGLALSGPDTVTLDAGSLIGPVTVSGGFDAMLYGQTGAASKDAVIYARQNGTNTSIYGDRDSGAGFGVAQTELKTTTGLIQFDLLIGAYGGDTALGEGTGRINLNTFKISPVKTASVTIQPPGSPISVSAGQLYSVEGYESGADFKNENIFASAMWWMQNSSNPGVAINFNQGPISATVGIGDGWDTYVFNVLQAYLSYTFNDNNNANFYYTGTLGHQGLNATTYGECGGSRCTVEAYGSNQINSQMYGGYYIWKNGPLSVVPEVQYVYAPRNVNVGVDKYTANFGAAIFTNYKFTGTEFSLGGMAQYFSSTGPGYWYINPGAKGFGFELTPTWQHKWFFARASVGITHLTDRGTDQAAYGNTGSGRTSVQGALQTGVVF